VIGIAEVARQRRQIECRLLRRLSVTIGTELRDKCLRRVGRRNGCRKNNDGQQCRKEFELTHGSYAISNPRIVPLPVENASVSIPIRCSIET
jgi:hypothetical protein